MFSAQALEVLVNREIPSDAEQAEIQAALLPLYLNLSFVALRLESPRKALKYAKKALEIDSGSTKALYRCAQVRLCFHVFKLVKSFVRM